MCVSLCVCTSFHVIPGVGFREGSCFDVEESDYQGGENNTLLTERRGICSIKTMQYGATKINNLAIGFM